jgi:hypothetical protein
MILDLGSGQGMRYQTLPESLRADHDRMVAKAFMYSVNGWFGIACDYHLKAVRKARRIKAFSDFEKRCQ